MPCRRIWPLLREPIALPEVAVTISKGQASTRLPLRHTIKPLGMSHEIAKLLLEHAETFLERTEAVQAAVSLGMPLDEIQDYLDWLDATRGVPFKRATPKPARGGESKPHGVEPQPPS